LKKTMQKIVHKATNYKPKPSKPKHIKDVVLNSFNGEAVRYIADALSTRLNTKENWAVVLKALIIVHSCFEEGSKDFEDVMVANVSSIFNLQRFKSFSPQNHPLTIFISKYARYLEEKVNVLKANGFQFEKKSEVLDGVSVSEQLKALPKLQSQFNALCNCRITNVQRASTIIIRAYILLLKDSITIYSMLSKAIVNLCEKFSKMSKKEASQFLTIYKLFVKETNAIIKIYDGARTISSNLPQIEKIDESIVSKLETSVGSNGEDNDEIDEIEENNEELLGTNKNLLFQTQTAPPKTSGEDKSESSGSSSGEEVDPGWNIFQPTKIVNTPQSFNPFAPPETTETTTTTNNTDPFNIFGPSPGNTKTTETGVFNPFEVPKTVPKTNNTTQQNNVNLFGFGNTNTNTNTTNNTSFNPFTTEKTTQPEQPKQDFNPFGNNGTTQKTTTTNNTNNNPFL